MNKILGLMTCFNRKNETLFSIETLIKKNKSVNFQFIIVDDNSSDGTREALSKISNVKLLFGNGSLFYSGGMRLAIDEALKSEYKFDYCLLFNDDVKFYPNIIEKMLESIGENILVGPTCNKMGNLSYGGIVKKSKIRPTFEVIDSKSSRANNCDTFNANCVLIPWDIFQKLGNMDEAYSHSLGDFDYGFSASRKGFKISVFKEFVGICCDNPVKGSWRDTSLTRRERIIKKESPKGLPRREWFYYLKKNYCLGTAIIYSIIPYIRIILNIKA